MDQPHVSIVIPVYNEEGILQGSVLEVREKLKPFGFTYELLLCENGSRDRTMEIGKQIEAEYKEVRFLSLGEPNYGLAMKMGIEEARGTFEIGLQLDRDHASERRHLPARQFVLLVARQAGIEHPTYLA